MKAYSFSPRTLSKMANLVVTNGQTVSSPRGDTVEIEDMQFVLLNPLDRVSTEPWRNFNVGFAIADALSHIVGDNKLDTLTQFAPSFAKYSTNGRTIDGAYGNRIHTNEQLHLVIQMLKRDNSTRQAVISIYMGAIDLAGGGGLNTPCTLSFHFLVRNGKLNMKVMMRSNDIYLGLPNDIFTFTMMQEYVSVMTGIPIGIYTHFASSFHLYDRDINRIPFKTKASTLPNMEPMPARFDVNRVFEAITQLRKMSIPDIRAYAFESTYSRDLFLSCACMAHKRVEGIHFIADEITMPILKAQVKMHLLEE